MSKFPCFIAVKWKTYHHSELFADEQRENYTYFLKISFPDVIHSATASRPTWDYSQPIILTADSLPLINTFIESNSSRFPLGIIEVQQNRCSFWQMKRLKELSHHDSLSFTFLGRMPIHSASDLTPWLSIIGYWFKYTVVMRVRFTNLEGTIYYNWLMYA